MDERPTTTRRWRGMEPDERDAQRRRRLLDAALELFGTQGYSATSIEVLCAQANVATKALYDLFGSREAVLRAAYDEVITEVAEGLEAALDDPATELPVAVRAAVAAYFTPLVRDERKGRLTQLEAVGVSAAFEQHRRGVIRAFAQRIDEHLERFAAAGALPEEERGLLTLVLAGGVSEALVDHLQTPRRRRRSLKALVDEISRIWFRALGVDAT